MQNVIAYQSRFRKWLGRFRGVATPHFPNYLGCREMFDATHITLPEALLKATIPRSHT